MLSEYAFRKTNENWEGRGEGLAELTEGATIKFVPILAADINADELLLMLALGPESIQHVNIQAAGRSTLENRELAEIFFMPRKSLGGGMLKFRDDKLVFFDFSSLGKFDPNLIRKVGEGQICQTFGVQGIVFE